MQTRERYESYLRDERLKEIFKNFTYINYDELKAGESSQSNRSKKNQNGKDKDKDIKFLNPHMNLSNFNDRNLLNISNNIAGSLSMKPKINENLANSHSIEPSINNNFLNISKMNVSLDWKKKADETTSNIENEFLRMKIQSNSATTMNMLRQNRNTNISQNSTNISSFCIKRGGSSTSNN